MGVRELTQCFARAGSRFSEMPEFVEERLSGKDAIHLSNYTQIASSELVYSATLCWLMSYW
jgi:hypothetical protein